MAAMEEFQFGQKMFPDRLSRDEPQTRADAQQHLCLIAPFGFGQLIVARHSTEPHRQRVFENPQQILGFERHRLTGDFAITEDVARLHGQANPPMLAIAIHRFDGCSIVHLHVDQNARAAGSEAGTIGRIEGGARRRCATINSASSNRCKRLPERMLLQP